MPNPSQYIAVFVIFGVVGLGLFFISRLSLSLRSDDPAVRKAVKTEVIVVSTAIVGLVAVITSGAAVHREIDLRSGDTGHFSQRQDRVIRLYPSGISFEVPESWVDWNARFHNNFHLTHRELRRVRVGSGEWDSEYATIVNAGLPFEDCSAHVGGDGWGREGASFADQQLRAYVTRLPTTQVIERIRTLSMKAAQQIAPHTGPKASLVDLSEHGWQHLRIQYYLWYGDYGGTARIDFFVKDVDHHRLVLVFMGPDLDGEIAPILASVQIPPF